MKAEKNQETFPVPHTFSDPHHVDADSDPAFTLIRIRIPPSTVVRIRILPFAVMRIRIWILRNDADPDPQHCLWHPIYRSCFLLYGIFVDNVYKMKRLPGTWSACGWWCCGSQVTRMMKSLVETTSHLFTPGITTSRDKRKKERLIKGQNLKIAVFEI
jgi:hypothetical protein